MYGPTGALTSLLFLMATRRNCGISGMSVGKSEWRKNEVTNVANILNCNSRPSSSFYLKKSKQVKQGFYSKKSSTSLRSYPYSSFAIQFSTIGRWPIRFCNLLLQRVDIFRSRLLQTPRVPGCSHHPVMSCLPNETTRACPVDDHESPVHTSAWGFSPSGKGLRECTGSTPASLSSASCRGKAKAVEVEFSSRICSTPPTTAERNSPSPDAAPAPARPRWHSALVPFPSPECPTRIHDWSNAGLSGFPFPDKFRCHYFGSIPSWTSGLTKKPCKLFKY